MMYCLREAEMKTITTPVKLLVIALLGVTTAVFGLARPDSKPQPIRIWDAALYDSEDCKPGLQLDTDCPDYTMRLQGKAFTVHIQDECDGQLADSGARKCIIAVDTKVFRDWGFRDPSVGHHKSMWVEYDCNPGIPGTDRIRAFGEEATAMRAGTPVAIICN